MGTFPASWTSVPPLTKNVGILLFEHRPRKYPAASNHTEEKQPIIATYSTSHTPKVTNSSRQSIVLIDSQFQSNIYNDYSTKQTPTMKKSVLKLRIAAVILAAVVVLITICICYADSPCGDEQIDEENPQSLNQSRESRRRKSGDSDIEFALLSPMSPMSVLFVGREL
ncbi:uncharacterized protein LY89DRAFT_758431 [Mollisia scopiformis]|uniref:Uncharacterized protein n=1 Tax=Mollisia scopiformis TaxID=149040 RepID=A0A194WUK6_MOLSC|nr:uncharacterized protein LY89DRAFT_758431 [Mollisia scopiformis]KUJ11648.1 hypothetical protein LY89DRAFT_758431 [Mollisia scopiformis]